MQVSRFPCPHCSTNLRIRDRSLVGQVIDCPDCGKSLEILADGPKQLTARVLDETSPAEASEAKPRKRRRRKRTKGDASKRPAKKQQAPETKPPFGQRLLNAFKNPVVVSWIVAIAATGTIVGVVLSRANDRKTESLADNDKTEEPKSVDDKSPQKKQANKQPVDPWNVDGQGDAVRMTRIGRLLDEYNKRRGEYPSATVEADGKPPALRFSWIARLVADSRRYGRRKPDWIRGWQDPVNEAFTRQQVDLFRNPGLPARPGRDGLPVTHFVGVAGVGADGPTLAANHPRAGIFAYNRATRRGDIGDGLANTMLLAPVRNRIGGWAVGGPATIRPFVAEPYINGPDGFGGRHGDRMQVLMADGSVRTISNKTAPVIVRRMAAMNDGFPLDPKVPGDPLKSRVKPPPIVKKKQQPPREPVAAVKPKRKPLDVKKINVAAALAQKVLRFENPGKATRRMLIAEVEELAGIPIRIDPQLTAAQSAPLDERVVVKLQKTTARKILLNILEKTGLAIAVKNDGVAIVAGKTPGP